MEEGMKLLTDVIVGFTWTRYPLACFAIILMCVLFCDWYYQFNYLIYV